MTTTSMTIVTRAIRRFGYFDIEVVCGHGFHLASTVAPSVGDTIYCGGCAQDAVIRKAQADTTPAPKTKPMPRKVWVLIQPGDYQRASVIGVYEKKSEAHSARLNCQRNGEANEYAQVVEAAL